MKKIFIYSYNLEIGGIERSLIGLLESIDKTKYEVDLFLAKQEGELMSHIPANVNLLPIDKRYQAFGVSIKQALKEGFYYEVFCRLYAKIFNKLINLFSKRKLTIEGFLYHKMVIKKMRRQTGVYDLAISFAMPYYYCLTKVNAKKKIGFVHTDYSKVHINAKFIKNMFNDIDYVASVSDSVKSAIQTEIKNYSDKFITIENLLSESTVYKLAKVEQSEIKKDSHINILSIGRFCNAKNFDNVPVICQKLIGFGLKVHWYIIGFGDQLELINQKIKQYNMEENVIILGKQENPYKYINACDIYIQPSRYEGKAVTVREAQMLGKPVIITNFSTSSSQIEDGVDGIIVPLDNEECAKGIYDFINNKQLQEKIKDNMLKRDYSNKKEVEKIYSIIEK